MRDRKIVSYPQEMRDIVKADPTKHLCCLDAAGMTYYGPFTKADRDAILRLITRIAKKKRDA